jgi:hypothetical protein
MSSSSRRGSLFIIIFMQKEDGKQNANINHRAGRRNEFIFFSHFLFHTWLSGGHVTGVGSVGVGHIG